MKLSNKEVDILKEAMVGTKISSGHLSPYSGGRITDNVGVIRDLYFDKERKQWRIKTEFSDLPFKDWLKYLYNNTTYRTQSKKLKGLADAYVDSLKAGDPQKFHEYIETMFDGKFTIHDVDVKDDELAWLEKHVVSIRARFPEKYKKNFLKNFPGAEYTIGENCWNYGFSMYFDDMSYIPDSLLELKNREGNCVDFDKKIMHNTSYIWKLVKEHPQFKFGKMKETNTNNQ